MSWLATGLFLLAYALLLKRHFHQHARQANARWDAIPAMYRLEDLRAWYAEHPELENAGLLDHDQPTPWTHALHRAATNGNLKDKAQLRMVINGWKPA